MPSYIRRHTGPSWKVSSLSRVTFSYFACSNPEADGYYDTVLSFFRAHGKGLWFPPKDLASTPIQAVKSIEENQARIQGKAAFLTHPDISPAYHEPKISVRKLLDNIMPSHSKNRDFRLLCLLFLKSVMAKAFFSP